MIIEALAIVGFAIIAYHIGVNDGLARATRLLQAQSRFDDIAMLEAGIELDRRDNSLLLKTL